MPLASWVVEFEAMSEVTQGVAVRDDRYTQDQLRVLAKYAKSSMVQRAIDEALQSDFISALPIEECELPSAGNGDAEGLQSIFGRSDVEDGEFEALSIDDSRLPIEENDAGLDFIDELEVNGQLYRRDADSIRTYTNGIGWCAVCIGGKEELDAYWANLNGNDLNRQGDKVAKIEADLGTVTVRNSKSDTMSLLLPVAEQINAEYAVFENLEKQATMSMLKIGLMMEHVKSELAHGQFKKWAEGNLNIQYRHAHRFHKLAQVFISAQKIEQGEMLALVNPDNSQQELGERLRQMAFEFLGDKTQAELFEEHGIMSKAKKERTLPQKDPNLKVELEPGESAKHLAAKGIWVEISRELERYGLDKLTRNLQNLYLNELRDLKGVLIDLGAEVDALIKAG